MLARRPMRERQDGIRTNATIADLFVFAESRDIAAPMRTDTTATEAMRVLGDDDEPVRAVIFTDTGDTVTSLFSVVAVREDVHLLHSGAALTDGRGARPCCR
ncbi:MAG: hypothetical protein WKF73_11940 [Nocardioidaceae bacterium]